MAEKKKGDYRVTVKVEIIRASGLYKVGDKPEVHPILAKRLIATDVAKAVSSKK